MNLTAIKTNKIRAGATTLSGLLDTYLESMSEGSILAITSKIVSLCEGRSLDPGDVSKEDLIRREADYYMPSAFSKYGYNFTIKRNTLTSMAGIDESNSEGQYVLWPKHPQKTANLVRGYLKKRFSLNRVGVVITDSTCMPMRRGTIGQSIGYSGFSALTNYIGQPDLFGREYKVSQGGVVNGLAAAAVLVMGEGTEQTPLVIISDLPFVKFQSRNPTAKELAYINLDKQDDLFAPFLGSVNWLKGGNGYKK